MEGLAVNREFWMGKKVFLTGHTGFKGTWLSLWLEHLGAEVHGYALPPNTSPSIFEVTRAGERMTSRLGDIRDPQALEAAMQASAAEIVIHMAAQPLVRYSYDHPVETFAVNVMGTANLLEAVRKTPTVQVVVNVTTDKCYENREWVWGYRENEPLGGHDPYSSSKACSELVTAAYRTSFFEVGGGSSRVAVATARAGNVIGGGDWAADRIVPDFVRAAEAGDPLKVRNPASIRPWQHVLEPLSGYLLLAERLHGSPEKYAGAWNFGPDDADAVPVGQIVETLARHWGPDARWIPDGGRHPHEATFLKLDCSKARQALAWSPRWTVDEAVSRSVDWYKAHGRADDLRAVSMAQIEAYASTLPE